MNAKKEKELDVENRKRETRRESPFLYLRDDTGGGRTVRKQG
jgi:hypothetical protein